MRENEKRPGPESEAIPTWSTSNHHEAGSSFHHNGNREQRERFTRTYYRSPRWDCGCHVPCRCEWHAKPTPKRVDAYREALEHLAGLGLLAGALTPELRELWRRGGDDRQVAERVARRWAA
jgi:hypothetical protein